METVHIHDRAAWNQFVAANADAHICQTYEWPEHSDIEASTKSLHLGVTENGELRAVVVLVHSRAQGVPAPLFLCPPRPHLQRSRICRIALAARLCTARIQEARSVHGASGAKCRAR